MSSPYEESMVSFNVRDEVKKLALIIQAPMEREPTIYRSYVLEKLVAILTETPIALDGEKQEQFNRWKHGPERLQ
jgi:hypothetical protein